MNRKLLALAALLALGPGLAAKPANPPAKTAPAPKTRTLTLRGTLTDLTTDLDTAVTLVVSLAGDQATATLQGDAPPFTGPGPLTGRFLDGWCELHGPLGGATIQLRGVINARDFRGTCVLTLPGDTTHYGKFQLSPPAPPR